MKKPLEEILQGYQQFREKYAIGDNSIMRNLANLGQQPEVMVVACCDSRVDPALLFQCDPGDLFVVRNVANIIPPYENDDSHHGTSAALEFGICFLGVKHLIILGHSQCGGIQALINDQNIHQNDFITNWVSLIRDNDHTHLDSDEQAKRALTQSYHHCLTFPWLKEKIEKKQLDIHMWFFDIKKGQIFAYDSETYQYLPLISNKPSI